MKYLGVIVMAAAAVLSMVDVSLASGAKEAAAGKAEAFAVNYYIWSVIVAGIGLSLAAMVGSMAQAKAIRQALEGISRQPEATGSIQTAMILGLAFIESLVIYVLLVSLILLFVNPFGAYFLH
ncbi:F0F1 ATP synthase subunit C [Elusimicrobiota bacterium]